MSRARNESATNPLATESLGSGDAATEHAIGKRLLVVEDNELNMEIAEFMLQNEGVVVTKAADGRQAVDAFAASKPGDIDVILMDVMMPVMDGLTATAEIRKFDPEIPIVALTAHAFDTDQLAALEAGCNEYLLKPIDKTKLMAVLRKYCHKP